MRWLFTLHLRAPGATVILVANKCDGSIDDFAETAVRVEKLAKQLLKEWQERRRKSRLAQNVSEVILLDNVSRVSCLDYGGIMTLVERISEQSSTSIQVPPAWNLALTVIDALRRGREPLQSAREHLRLTETLTSSGEEDTTVANTTTTKTELLDQWEGIVRQVSVEAHANGQSAVVSNWQTALDGALWISEFAGQILRIDGGEGIFLDVVWLSTVLSPILSHKLRNEILPSPALCGQRDSLFRDGVLRWDFALYLWRPVLTPALRKIEESVVKSLFRVLLKLGVILPLGRIAFSADDQVSYRPHGDTNSNDTLVIMRLPEACTQDQKDEMDKAVARPLDGCRKVKLSWRFDPAGAPYGLIERLIASCRVIGTVEQGLCWRYGALFKSHAMTKRRGRRVRLYTFVIRYEGHYHPGHDDPTRMLTLTMIGPISNVRVWNALQYVASAMVILSMEWPGVRWEGWSECPEHELSRMYLTSPVEAEVGSPLLDLTHRDAQSNSCDCQREANGVLGLVRKRLGRVLDTRTGDSFEGFEEYVPPGACDCCHEVSVHLRPKAWQAAVALGTLGLTLFCSATVPGLVEENDVLWITSSSVVVLLLAAALVFSRLAYRNMLRAPQIQELVV